jgi:VCBS repeat-containing protein
MMKKILGLTLGLLLSAFTFGQSAITFTDATSGYDKSATTAFHFTFDSSISNETITTNSAYYTDYFTVDAVADGANHNVTFTLVDDTDMSRRVISRFFISIQAAGIDVNGTVMTIDEFMAAYIMND